MEKLGLKLKSSLAKSIGTIILIFGALLMTFYRGPPIFSNQSITPPNSFHQLHITTKSNWIFGGFLLATANMLLALLYIAQAWVINDYPEEFVVTTVTCGLVTIISGLVGLIAENNLSSWRLKPDLELITVCYARKMKMESVVPFILMVIQQLAQVGLMVASQVTTSAGLSTFTFLFYSSALSTIILIPLSFFLHRSALPPLRTTFIHGFFLLGITGFLMQVFTLIGLQHSSPLLSTSILQLVPGFTFIFAVLLRMEAFECKNLSTLAKTIGTLVSIIGALVATLYKGPQILNSTFPNLLNQPSSWVIGGLVAMIGAIITSLFIISQAFVLKKYQAEMVVMLFYSCGVTVFCLVSSLTTARDLSSWIINSQAGILALMYSAVFGSVFQVCINSWVVKRRGPLFVVMFHPLGIVFAMAASLFMGETIHLGSLVGSIIIAVGFYSVIWGKAKEWEKEKMSLGSNNNNKKMPLLQDKVDDPEVNL